MWVFWVLRAPSDRNSSIYCRDIPGLPSQLWGRSERSAGKSYAEAVNWIEAVESSRRHRFHDGDRLFTSFYERCRFCLLGPWMLLVATEWKVTWPGPVFRLFPNAKEFTAPIRMFTLALYLEVNATHTEMIKAQDFDPSGRGFIVTNPNCVAVPLVMALETAYGCLWYFRP